VAVYGTDGGTIVEDSLCDKEEREVYEDDGDSDAEYVVEV
jgi:hypothetical protein